MPWNVVDDSGMCRPGFTRASKVSSARTARRVHPHRTEGDQAVAGLGVQAGRLAVEDGEHDVLQGGGQPLLPGDGRPAVAARGRPRARPPGPAGSSPGSPMIRTIPGSSGPVMRASRIGVPATVAAGRSPASARASRGVRSSASNTPKMLRPAAIRERETSIRRAAGLTSRIRPLSSTTPTGTSRPASTANRTSRSRVSSACAPSSCSVRRSSARGVPLRQDVDGTLDGGRARQAVGRVDGGDDLDVGGLPGVVALFGAPRAPRHPSDTGDEHDQAEGEDEPLGAQRVEQGTPRVRRQVGQDHRDGQAGNERGDGDEREDPPSGHDPPPGESGSQVGPVSHGRHRLGCAHGSEGLAQGQPVVLGEVVDDDEVREREPGVGPGRSGPRAAAGRAPRNHRPVARRAPRRAGRRQPWPPAAPECRQHWSGRPARRGARAARGGRVPSA